MYLDRFAEVFEGAGLTCSCSTTATSAPAMASRGRRSTRGPRSATTATPSPSPSTLPEVDAARIGIWGSSYSGGHVLVVAAIDRRVKAVVSQVPLVSGHDNLRALVRSDFIAGFQDMFDADRPPALKASRPPWSPSSTRTRSPHRRCHHGLLEVVHRDRQGPRPVLAQRGDAAQRRDVHRLRARRAIALYQPDTAAPAGGADDHVVPSELAIEAYDRAHEPKHLVILNDGHFDVYNGIRGRPRPARDWFVQHLAP